MASAWPPQGQAVRVEVTRDTWVSGVGQEGDGNNGAASRVKVKGYQELTLLDIDARPLAGRVINGATLHLKLAGKDVLRRATVSSVSSAWVEGSGSSYNRIRGAASYNWAEQDIRPWAWPGSDINAVICGEGNSVWRFADATPPDEDGWQTLAVDPLVMAARVAGISQGFAVYDDVGSEYERNGNQFKYQQLPNRFFYSRDQNKSVAPYFTVYVGVEDREAPPAVGEFKQVDTVLPPGEAKVSWTTPRDAGPAGTIGFVARYAKGASLAWDSATPVPQYLVPLAGDGVAMHLRDMGLPAGEQILLGVRAVDGAGNVGPVVTVGVRASAEPASVKLADAPAGAFEPNGEPLQVGDLQVAVVDALDKISPATGQMIPSRRSEYLLGNHLFSAAQKKIRLFAARNEFADCQVLLSGKTDAAAVSLKFDDPALKPALYRFRHVAAKSGPLPDPLVPLDGPVSLPARDESIAEQRHAGIVADVYVPHETRPGRHAGKLSITAGGQTLELAVELNVWDFALPDQLSFLPEMNCYGLTDQEELAFYRLAHAHRTCLNRLGYNWRGVPNDGCAPKFRGGVYDFADYDRRFGPLLDGSAFADLPRKGVPVETFYLPICENWPVAIDPEFKGGYWIESALTANYREAFVKGVSTFVAHANQKNWLQTLFELYLNNKVYYKQDDWRKCSAPWIFDEPACTQDYWALRWYGIALHEGVARARGAARFVYRADISRPQFQRDMLDGLLDVNVLGGDYRRYWPMVMDRKQRDGQLAITYGTSNAIDQSNVQPAAWCLDAWTMGLDGVLPWQTVGTADSWKKADELSVLYPAGPMGLREPAASVRLKSYRRGQQDVEYLTILSQVTRQPRFAVSRAVRETLHLSATSKRSGEGDAGTVSFASLSPEDLWRLRIRIGTMLDQRHPENRAKWIDLTPPGRKIEALPYMGYVRPAPER
jgi:hypothetical protein